MTRAAPIACAFVLWGLSSAGVAQERTIETECEQSTGECDLLVERRSAPDYDGRDELGPEPSDVLLWVPRVLLAPLSWFLDYGIRRPLGFLLEIVEREHWDSAIIDFFTWNEGCSGVVPRFFIAYGLQPSAGLSLFSNDEVAEGHSVRASATTGGVDLLEAGASYAIEIPERRSRVMASARVGRRPDRVFSGIGWDAVSERYRFRESEYDISASTSFDFWRESLFMIRLGVDGHEFDPNGYVVLGSSPSLATGIETGQIAEPYGLEQPYVVFRSRAEFAVDSREREPKRGDGARIDAHAELAFDLNDPLARRWVQWGGSIGGFIDLGHHRVLGLWGLVRFSDPLGAEPVPFTELIALGQDALLMQGFLRGQLRGRSAVAATVEYRYPIWSRLDARIHVAVGNVFDTHFNDFEWERLRLSFGLGISTVGDPDEMLEIIVAAGTAPFVFGASVDSFQLVFGTRRGF